MLGIRYSQAKLKVMLAPFIYNQLLMVKNTISMEYPKPGIPAKDIHN